MHARGTSIGLVVIRTPTRYPLLSRTQHQIRSVFFNFTLFCATSLVALATVSPLLLSLAVFFCASVAARLVAAPVAAVSEPLAAAVAELPAAGAVGFLAAAVAEPLAADAVGFLAAAVSEPLAAGAVGFLAAAVAERLAAGAVAFLAVAVVSELAAAVSDRLAAAVAERLAAGAVGFLAAAVSELLVAGASEIDLVAFASPQSHPVGTLVFHPIVAQKVYAVCLVLEEWFPQPAQHPALSFLAAI